MRNKHRKDKIPAAAEPEAFKEVRLKSILGIRPGVYLEIGRASCRERV
jgi:hypothetical protein